VREEIQELREEVSALRAAVRKHAKVLDVSLVRHREREPYRNAPPSAPALASAPAPAPAPAPKQRKNLHVRFAD
jgi:hypothetical protein